MCWSPVPGEKLTLSALPQLQYLFGEALESVHRIERFVQLCEEDLSECLRENKLPSLQLVEAIAVAKVRKSPYVVPCLTVQLFLYLSYFFNSNL